MSDALLFISLLLIVLIVLLLFINRNIKKVNKTLQATHEDLQKHMWDLQFEVYKSYHPDEVELLESFKKDKENNPWNDSL